MENETRENLLATIPASLKGTANGKILVMGKNEKVRFLCKAHIDGKLYFPGDLVPAGLYPAGTTYTQKEEN